VTARRLAHDVGKYVARAAHNLRPGERAAPAVVAMLAADLYALPGGRRASSLFDELAAPLDGDPRIERARALLAEADSLEGALRAGAPDAVERGRAIALEVERLLRAVAT
jgi:hypothetical protein